jgi:DHA1 family multidrug resistance protein-like MFS transporter
MSLAIARVNSSWLWLLGLFTAASIVETVFAGQIGAFTPLYLPRLGVSAADVAFWSGASWSMSMALGLPFLPLWGALADRYARQPIIVRSYLVYFIAAVVAMLAHSLWLFILARAVLGFALGNSGLMLATMAERIPAKRQGLAFAVMNTAQPVGAFIGPVAGGPIVDAYGFPAVLAIDGVLLAAVVLALAFGYRDTFVGSKDGPLLGMAIGSLRLIATTPRLRTLFLAMTLVLAAWVLPFTYVPLVVEAMYRGTQPGTTVGLVIGASGLTTAVLGPLVGSLADRWGIWRILFVVTTLLVVLLPLPALAPNLVSFAVAWALVSGVAVGAYALSFNALANSVTTEVRGRVMALAYVPGNLAFIVGPAIGSVVASTNVFAVFPVASVVGLAGLALLVYAGRMATSDVRASVPR